MLGWSLNLDFAGSDSGAAAVVRTALLLMGVGILRLMVVI